MSVKQMSVRQEWKLWYCRACSKEDGFTTPVLSQDRPDECAACGGGSISHEPIPNDCNTSPVQAHMLDVLNSVWCDAMNAKDHIDMLRESKEYLDICVDVDGAHEYLSNLVLLTNTPL